MKNKKVSKKKVNIVVIVLAVTLLFLVGYIGVIYSKLYEKTSGQVIKMKLSDYNNLYSVSEQCKITKCELILTDTGLDYNLVLNFIYDTEQKYLIPITLEYNNLSMKLATEDNGVIGGLDIKVFPDKYIALVTTFGMYSSTIYTYDEKLNLIDTKTKMFLELYKDGIKYRTNLYIAGSDMTDRLYNPKNPNYDPNRIVAYTYYEKYLGKGKFGNKEIIKNIIAKTDYPSSGYTN